MIYNSVEEIPEDRYLETILNGDPEEDADELGGDDEEEDEWSPFSHDD
jgi:hypothetical protein